MTVPGLRITVDALKGKRYLDITNETNYIAKLSCIGHWSVLA